MERSIPERIPTTYVGIYIQVETGAAGDSLYWIVDDNGNDKYFWGRMPNQLDIESYVQEILS